MLFITILLLLFGFLVLIKGADLFVDGARAAALYMHISPFVVGLTIVAFATSMPELAVNIIAAAKGETALAIGNVLGSNIANIGLILGVTVIFTPLVVKGSTVWREIPFMILGLLVLLTLVSDAYLGLGDGFFITRTDGIILLLFFCVFMYYTIASLVKIRGGLFHFDEEHLPEEDEKPTMSKTRATVYLFIGLVGLVLGADFIVDNGLVLAERFSLTHSFVGLTIVALGTSLPELAASVTAARKNSPDLAIGNIIGSNIYNIFLILGITATIETVPFPHALYTDLFILMALSFFLFLFLVTHHKTLRRWEGLFLLFGYFVFLLFAVIRG